MRGGQAKKRATMVLKKKKIIGSFTISPQAHFFFIYVASLSQVLNSLVFSIVEEELEDEELKKKKSKSSMNMVRQFCTF